MSKKKKSGASYIKSKGHVQIQLHGPKDEAQAMSDAAKAEKRSRHSFIWNTSLSAAKKKLRERT